MGRMSDLHDDLTSIYTLIMDHRANAIQCIRTAVSLEDTLEANKWRLKVEALDDLLIEIEAQGIQWPDIEGIPVVLPMGRRGADNDC